jgi:hypothetical protein
MTEIAKADRTIRVVAHSQIRSSGLRKPNRQPAIIYLLIRRPSQWLCGTSAISYISTGKTRVLYVSTASYYSTESAPPSF